MRKLLLIILIFFSGICLEAQSNLDSLNAILSSDKETTVKIDAALAKSGILELSDYDSAKKAALWALRESKKTDYAIGIYGSYYALASMHYESSQMELMTNYLDSMKVEMNDQLPDKRKAEGYNLIGIASYGNNDLIGALSSWQKASELYEEEERSGVISNLGNIYLSSNKLDKAKDYFMQAIEINEKIKHHSFLVANYYNLALCSPLDVQLSIEYLHKSIENANLAGYRRALPTVYTTLVNQYAIQGAFKEASAAIDSLNAFSIEMGDEIRQSFLEPSVGYYRYQLGKAKLNGRIFKDTDIKDANLSGKELLQLSVDFFESASGQSLGEKQIENQYMADIYKILGNYESSAFHFERSLSYKDSIEQNKAQFMLKEHELTIKEAEERELELQALNEKQKQEQKLFMAFGGLGLILLVSIGLWSRLRYVRRSRAAIQSEKEVSDNLLLNILPADIAAELKEKGRADARDFDRVSILFTDFKGFTAASEKLSAQELVAEINTCFEAFDGIMDKYNIEKIKTIGDAYMAAGGLPVPTDYSVKNTVLAAVEMQDFISKRKIKLDAEEKPAFEMRVGVHTGPVVAGIVGVKKFQYDIWGDTVNTASRMESSGKVGKVNISQSTYEMLKDDETFTFESRGKIEAKGKGEIEMYFVAKA